MIRIKKLNDIVEVINRLVKDSEKLKIIISLRWSVKVRNCIMKELDSVVNMIEVRIICIKVGIESDELKVMG